MISLDSLRPEFIDKTAECLKIVDKAVLERAIHAFVLLDRLAGTRAEFTFKGGTSLLLQLKEPRRLSVDIDTFCVMPADEFRSILEKEVCRNPPFFKMEDDLRGAYDQPQRRHYKLYYKTAYNKMRNDVINGFDFTFPIARLYAAKAAFVAAQILAGRSVQVPEGVPPVSFAGNLKILSRTKTLNPDVYQHWAAVAKLLPDWQPEVL